MSGRTRSGVASAGGVAPNPGRSRRRSIQTVVMPSALAGTWSWNRLWATWRMRSRGTSDSGERQLEVPRVGFVAAGLLGGHDPVECDAEAAIGHGEQVVVAVRDDAQPVASGQAGERGRGIREGRPLPD